MSEQDEDISGRLIDEGWRQGSTFSLSGTNYLAVAVASAGDLEVHEVQISQEAEPSIYVVVSQTCDIKASACQEPFIEAMLCTVDSSGEYRQRARNSFRWFDVGSGDLVVHAAYRLVIAKQSLIDMVPEPWPSSDHRRNRFQAWLAKRAGRKALPDALVDAIVKPIQSAFQKNRKKAHGKAYNRLVRETRFFWPVEATPPFHFALMLLLEDVPVSQEESEQFDRMLQILMETFESSDHANLIEILKYTDSELSLYDYERSLLVDMDSVTYSGEEIRGAEPVDY